MVVLVAVVYDSCNHMNIRKHITLILYQCHWGILLHPMYQSPVELTLTIFLGTMQRGAIGEELSLAYKHPVYLLHHLSLWACCSTTCMDYFRNSVLSDQPYSVKEQWHLFRPFCAFWVDFPFLAFFSLVFRGIVLGIPGDTITTYEKACSIYYHSTTV